MGVWYLPLLYLGIFLFLIFAEYLGVASHATSWLVFLLDTLYVLLFRGALLAEFLNVFFGIAVANANYHKFTRWQMRVQEPLLSP